MRQCPQSASEALAPSLIYSGGSSEGLSIVLSGDGAFQSKAVLSHRGYRPLAGPGDGFVHLYINFYGVVVYL